MNSEHHQRFAVDRNMRVDVSAPKAFPLPDGLRRTLIKFLRQFDFVSAAYLVQFTYAGDTDPRVGKRPCLTLGLDIDRPDCEQLVADVSSQSAPVLAGQLGEWQFLDFFPLTPSTTRAFQNSGAPIYVRP